MKEVSAIPSAERKREMIEQIKEYLGIYSHAEFARKMGISTQNAFSWQQRGAFNAELLISKFPELSGDWLLTGKGEMLRSRRTDEIPDEKILAALMEEQKLTAKAQEQADRMLSLLNTVADSLDRLSKEKKE